MVNHSSGARRGPPLKADYLRAKGGKLGGQGFMGIARACCETGVESLGFYGPEGAGKAGPAVLLPPERDAASEALLWRESLKSTGISQYFGWAA